MEPSATRLAGSACLVGLLGVLSSLLPATLEIEEDPGLRWLFELRGPVQPPPRVTIVAISRDSAETLGTSPELDEWPRDLHAELIERLDALGAAVIVFDVMFEKARDDAADERLADAIAESGKVVLLERVDTPPDLPAGLPQGSVLETRYPPLERFARAALAAAPFTLPTRPLRTSQFWVFGRTDDSVPTLPAVALQAYALGDYARFIEHVRDVAADTAALDLPRSVDAVRASGLTETVRKLRVLFAQRPELAERLSADRGSTEDSKSLAVPTMDALIDLYAGPSARYLNFYGPARSIRTIPFEQLIRPGAAGPQSTALDGHAVFIGYSERRQPVQEDDFLSAYSEASGLNLSGVEIAATAFANLLEQRSLEPVPRWLHLLWLFVWGAALTGALGQLKTSTAIALGLACGVVLLGFAWWRLAVATAWWPVVVPLGIQLPAALCVAAYWNHRRLNQQRQRIQTALGYYVPSDVLDRLVLDSVDRGARRELVYGTCLVSDVERFTSLSEQLGAEALGDLMERYYQTLSRAAERHGGFIADVSGDSIVAIWTNARSRVESKQRACLAALEMRRAIEAFNLEHAPRRLPTRFGLDSGEVLVGNIGIAARYQYRAVGDIVNTASRIQGLNRLLGTQVLASAASIDTRDAGVSVRAMGRFLLLGKTTPIDVYELSPAASEADAAARTFERALRAFAERRFDTARSHLHDVLASRPDDGPSRFYLRQCDRYATMATDAAWGGTIEITVK